MASTINQGFAQLKQNLEITQLQSETVSVRQRNVRDALAVELTVTASFLTGSYSRKTMIAPLKNADIDIFVVLDNSYFYNYSDGKNGGPAGLLDRVRRVLKRTYPSTPDISRSGQAVSITFSDFVVDVVPAFKRQGGGYLIPNSMTGTWISTDPAAHVEIMSAQNARQNGMLVPLVKMIKRWNRVNGSFFRSFHLEVMSLEIFQSVTISDYPSGMRYFFDKARTVVAGVNKDPAGYGGDVGSYINTQQKITDAVGKFQLAYDRALRAEILGSQESTAAAFESWRKVFGDYFPTYG